MDLQGFRWINCKLSYKFVDIEQETDHGLDLVGQAQRMYYLSSKLQSTKRSKLQQMVRTENSA